MADKKDDWMMWLLGGGAVLAILSLLGLNKGNDDKFSGHWHDQHGGHGGGFGVDHPPSGKKPGCGPCSLGK